MIVVVFGILHGGIDAAVQLANGGQLALGVAQVFVGYGPVVLTIKLLIFPQAFQCFGFVGAAAVALLLLALSIRFSGPSAGLFRARLTSGHSERFSLGRLFHGCKLRGTARLPGSFVKPQRILGLQRSALDSGVEQAQKPFAVRRL